MRKIEHHEAIARQIAEHQKAITHLQAQYDKAYLKYVQAEDNDELRLTVAQITLLRGTSLGGTRNLMSRKGLKAEPDNHGTPTLSWATVKKHLLNRHDNRGKKQSETIVQAVKSLRASTVMTQAEIAAAMKISVKTVQRILTEQNR